VLTNHDRCFNLLFCYSLQTGYRAFGCWFASPGPISTEGVCAIPHRETRHQCARTPVGVVLIRLVFNVVCMISLTTKLLAALQISTAHEGLSRQCFSRACRYAVRFLQFSCFSFPCCSFQCCDFLNDMSCFCHCC